MARRIGEKRLHIKGLIAGPKADRAIGYLPPARRPKSSYVRFEAALPNQCWAGRLHPLRVQTIPMS
jgi:hypothetical protein